MSEAIWFSTVLMASFGMGFYFGQKSIRTLATRTERMVVSDRLTVERTLPEESEKKVPVTRETLEDDDATVIVPKHWRQYVDAGKEE